MSPKEDEKSIEEIDSLKNKLKKYVDNIHKLDLEQFVNDAQNSDSKEYKELASKFHRRYLDFSLVENLV